MAYIEKENNINSKSNSKEKNEILEKIIRIDESEKFCHYFREENKQIEDIDKWKISDFFGLNDLERIKQTPEYIIEKIVILLKNFINLNDYFFIMKQNEDWKNIIENMNKNQKENKNEECNKNVIPKPTIFFPSIFSMLST